MLLLLATVLSSDNSRASLSLAIPVTSSDSLILEIFLVVVEAVDEAEEAIEAVGNGGNFGECKVTLTVAVVLTTPWLILLISEDDAEVEAAAEAEILQG